MSLLLRFERRIEALVEGLFTRWARDRVHPVEIGRRAIREMEAGAVAGLHGALLPNEYRVFLNPKDFAPYRSFAPALIAELADLLGERAGEIGGRPAGPIHVSVEAREAIAPGEIYVEARLAPDAQPSPGAGAAGTEAPPGGDLRASGRKSPAAGGGSPPSGALPAPSAARPGAPASDTRIYRHAASPAGARLRVLAGPAGTAGREYPLDRPVLTIGRRADQDIVIDDPGVSRAHARIHLSGRDASVEDLGSTNGTALNGRPIGRGRTPVHDGDRIQVGSAVLQYRSGG